MDFNDLFKGALTTWGLEEWIIIGLGVLILIIILALLFKPKKKKTVPYKEVKVEQKAPTPEAVKNTQPETPPMAQETKMEAVKPPVKADEPKAEVVKPSAKAPVQAETKAETETEKVIKYHVSQNKDQKSEFKNQWRVRKQGSSKTIKYFKTQAEAIKYAESLAENNDTSIVIHKRDGSIRKQDYTKKKSS